MANKFEKFFAVDALFDERNLNALRNAASAQPDQINEVCRILGSFIVSVQSGDDTSKVVLSKLSTPVGQMIFQKVIAAYVWFYSYYLTRKLDLSKTAFREADCKKIVEGLQTEEKENKLLYSLFNELQSGKHTSIAGSPFGNGYSRSSSTIPSLLIDDNVKNKVGIKDDSTTSSGPLTVEQLLNSTDYVSALSKEPAPLGEEDLAFLSKILSVKEEDENKKGIKNFISRIALATISARVSKKKIKTENLFGENDFNEFPFLAKNRELQNSIKKVFDDYKEVDSSNYQRFINKICDTIKTPGKKESTQQGSIEDFASQLAMNMANYMTGKISAVEFQRIDRAIRDAQGFGREKSLEQPLNEAE